jgi:hypothetical protein
MKKFVKMLCLLGVVLPSVLCAKNKPLPCPPIARLTRKMIPISATSAVDSLTSAKSNVRIDSGGFGHGAELTSTNNASTQGANIQQMGVSAGQSTINSAYLTGGNLTTVGKMMSGATGGLQRQMLTGAVLSNSSSTVGKALTSITGNGGNIGNSTIGQTNTTLGANLALGPVTGPSTMVNLSGNPYIENS